MTMFIIRVLVLLGDGGGLRVALVTVAGGAAVVGAHLHLSQQLPGGPGGDIRLALTWSQVPG